MHPAIEEERRIHKKPNHFKLEKDDVWGAWDGTKKIKKGLIVAHTDQRCPIFGDAVPYKSVTIVFDPEKYPYDEVTYWLSYVHGGGCIDKEIVLDDGKIAIRSDYQCW